jgi:hypothetical protein
MTDPPTFEDIAGDDLPRRERERLRRVHDLLVAAGPPPELPPSLEAAPSQTSSIRFLPRRRRGAILALAAAFAAAAFGGGYLVGDRGTQDPFATEFVVQMRGTAAAPRALASLKVGSRDDDGNWPMLMTVRGLPKLPSGETYALKLTRNGKPAVSCGTFRIESDKAVVQLSAAYKLKRFTGWAITREGSSRILVRTEKI